MPIRATGSSIATRIWKQRVVKTRSVGEAFRSKVDIVEVGDCRCKKDGVLTITSQCYRFRQDAEHPHQVQRDR